MPSLSGGVLGILAQLYRTGSTVQLCSGQPVFLGFCGLSAKVLHCHGRTRERPQGRNRRLTYCGTQIFCFASAFAFAEGDRPCEVAVGSRRLHANVLSYRLTAGAGSQKERAVHFACLPIAPNPFVSCLHCTFFSSDEDEGLRGTFCMTMIHLNFPTHTHDIRAIQIKL